jgi:predicted alpha/beta hydrolase family esterase
MKNAIIVHGTMEKDYYYDLETPSASNGHWLPWLQNALLTHDVRAVTPEMYKAYMPDYDLWCGEVERYDIGPETALVGHSNGGGFWLRYLSDRPDLRVGRVILVAPWLDPKNQKENGFFDFTIDPYLLKRCESLTIFHSDNDMPTIQKCVAAIRDALPDVGYREFHKYGHFTQRSMGTTAFPELLEAIVGTTDDDNSKREGGAGENGEV